MKQSILTVILASITLFGMDNRYMLKNKLNEIINKGAREEFDKHQTAFAKTLEHPDILWAKQCCERRLAKIENKLKKQSNESLETKKQNSLYIFNALKEMMNSEFEPTQAALSYDEDDEVYYRPHPKRKQK